MRLWLAACAAVVALAGEEADAECQARGVFEGLKLRFEERQLPEGGSAAVLPGPVFYKRPLIRIPASAVLLPNDDVQQRVRQYARDQGPLQIDSSDGEAEQLVALALALLAERNSASSPFKSWLELVASEKPPLALQMSDRQQSILAGTTVESAREQMTRLRDAVLALAHPSDLTAEAKVEEANWALGVAARRAQHVVLPEDGRRVLRLIMVTDLFKMRMHPDALQAPPLVETTALAAGKERRLLLRAAERDYHAGEELFLWTGRLSDSELLLRGIARPNASSMKNPTGIGGKVRIPENWNTNPRTPNFKEFRKFNCTSQEAFEVRLSKKGWPMRSFVRCYRVAWLLLNNWYSPKVINQTQLLDKWPPPKKYSHEDWLGWTQADQAINSEIQEYCTTMRSRLRNSIDSTTAEDFRRSDNSVDKILWKLRSEESKADRKSVV